MTDEEIRELWDKAVRGVATNLARRYRRDLGDITQDLWAWVFRNRNTVAKYGPGALRQALYGYGSQQCMKALTQERRYNNLYSDGEMEVLLGIALDPGRRAEAKPGWERVFERVEEALEGLPEEDQELLTLRFGEGLSVRQVAERFEISRSVIGERSQRAMARLQSAFERPTENPDATYVGTANMGAGYSRARETAWKRRREWQ